MIEINVKADVDKFRQFSKDLTDRQINIATSRAINRTLLQGRTVARDAVKRIYNIPQRYVGGININRSTTASKRENYLTGSIYASTKPIPMDAFAPRFSFNRRSVTSISRRGVSKTKFTSRGNKNFGQGVSIEVIKGKREIVPFAFMLPSMSGRVFGRGMYKTGNNFGFVRRNKRQEYIPTGNDSVTPMLSVSVHAAVINKTAENNIKEKVVSVFPPNLSHEFQNIFRTSNAR